MESFYIAAKSVIQTMEDVEIIPVPAGRYVVFSVGKYKGEGGLAEEMKHLIHYAYLK